jgi:glycosyltransferase involved in cell wall biosynthesis
MKVAIYVPHGAIPDIRGFAPAIVAWNFALHLKAVSSLVICAREDYSGDFDVVSGIPIHRIREGRLYRRLFRKITRLDPYPLHRRAAHIVNREAPDLVHAHQLEFPVADFAQRLRRRVPVVLHAHVTTNMFDRARGVAHRYIAASQYIKERLVTVKGYPADRIEVVPNGVDTALFSPPGAEEKAALRGKFHIPRDAVVLAFVGRKQEVKGFHIFLQAAEALLTATEDLHVLTVGPELKEGEREESYAWRRQVREQLRRTGRYSEFPALPQAELAGLYQAADILLLPSLSEPQGMTVIESMACGCVTISSNRGGIPESLEHGVTGYLLDNPEDLAEVVALTRRAIENNRALKELRRAARTEAVQRFDWKTVSARLERIYLSI